MQKLGFDGRLMQFSTPFARAVLPKELAGPKSDKLLGANLKLQVGRELAQELTEAYLKEERQ